MKNNLLKIASLSLILTGFFLASLSSFSVTVYADATEDAAHAYCNKAETQTSEQSDCFVGYREAMRTKSTDTSASHKWCAVNSMDTTACMTGWLEAVNVTNKAAGSQAATPSTTDVAILYCNKVETTMFDRTDCNGGYKEAVSTKSTDPADSHDWCITHSLGTNNGCTTGWTQAAKSIKAAEDSQTIANNVKEFCKDKKTHAACVKGVTGQVKGQSVDVACKGLSGANKKACAAGYSSVVKAQTPPATATTTPQDSTPSVECNQDHCDIVAKYINPAINLLSGIFGLLAVASLVMAGIQYSASGGDPQKIMQAKKRISTTVVAIVGFFFLYAFLQFLIPGGIF